MNHLFAYPDRVKVYAIALFVIGLLLRYIIGKRRFNRRGVAGMQYFKSYATAQTTMLFEKLTNILGTLLIIGGIILYLLK